MTNDDTNVQFSLEEQSLEKWQRKR